MKKILVPSDFSPNSKSGVRFAIQWAAKQNIELVFIHVLKLLIPTRWSQAVVTKYVAGESEACSNQFRKFIEEIFKKMDVNPGLYSTVVVHANEPAKAILEYCRKDTMIDIICISTNGAGLVRKLFGTNTSGLISKSPVPVLAIPKNYKTGEIKSVLYATDFRNYKEELAKVLRFAASFRAKVDVIHFSWPGEVRFEDEDIEKISGNYEFGLHVDVEICDAAMSLTESLKKAVAKRKPSVVVMFTNQERDFIERILFSSKAEDLSFSLKTPLLVYSKEKSLINRKKQELV